MDNGCTRPKSQPSHKPLETTGEESAAALPLHHGVCGLRGPHRPVDGGGSEVDRSASLLAIPHPCLTLSSDFCTGAKGKVSEGCARPLTWNTCATMNEV